jgi:hypothetical protein
MTLVCVLVVPKIRRVASGEKIVVSAFLNSRYRTLSSGKLGYESTLFKATLNHPAPAEERLLVKLDEPMPHSIELELLRMHETLQDIQNLW